jgi:ferredoxin
MVPFVQENMMTVACRSLETGKSTRGNCKVGCIGCGICAKQTDIFIVDNNLAKLDYKNYQSNEQTETAYNKCPTCVIVYRGKSAPEPRVPAKKKAAAAKA